MAFSGGKAEYDIFTVPFWFCKLSIVILQFHIRFVQVSLLIKPNQC